METNNLQAELFNYIKANRLIAELEVKKNKAAQKREAAEILENTTTNNSIKEFAVVSWNVAYQEELELEIQILKLKKEQSEFILKRLLAK
jgi:hypothetical protein